MRPGSHIFQGLTRRLHRGAPRPGAWRRPRGGAARLCRANSAASAKDSLPEPPRITLVRMRPGSHISQSATRPPHPGAHATRRERRPRGGAARLCRANSAASAKASLPEPPRITLVRIRPGSHISQSATRPLHPGAHATRRLAPPPRRRSPALLGEQRRERKQRSPPIIHNSSCATGQRASESSDMLHSCVT
ncbi:MAG: hypothetical protein ACI9XZ_000498 [Alphaproteobacteria bacterium]|jgi:hypothetical protein